MKQKPLPAGRTVFFAVQPKFMNVNIRVTLDVTHGSINVYLSPKDDTFLIKQDDRWIHRVSFVQFNVMNLKPLNNNSTFIFRLISIQNIHFLGIEKKVYLEKPHRFLGKTTK